MKYDTGSHCVFDHRYHRIWSIKYRYKVLTGDIRLRVRDICRQVCHARGLDIIRGVLSSDCVQMFVSFPPKLAVSYLVRLMKGQSSHIVKRAFPQPRKHCRTRGHFSTTSEDTLLHYLEQHIAHPTGTSRQAV